MATTDVLTYMEVLQRLGLEADEKHEQRTLPLITAVTRRLEAATGSYFVQRSYTERHETHRRTREMILYRRPIVSVTSIIDMEENTVPGTDYYVFAEEGRLRHKGYWPTPYGCWVTTLVGGWAINTAAVGSNVKQAACLLLQEAFSQEGGRVITGEHVGPVSVSYAASESWESLPRPVQDLLIGEQHVGV